MGQITLYLDSETESRMKAAAKAAGISQSKWITHLIRESAPGEWPATIKAMAGAWPDAPQVEDTRQAIANHPDGTA
jgi:hypothetical protein